MYGKFFRIEDLYVSAFCFLNQFFCSEYRVVFDGAGVAGIRIFLSWQCGVFLDALYIQIWCLLLILGFVGSVFNCFSCLLVCTWVALVCAVPARKPKLAFGESIR